jgi:DNA polymerase III delta prime subunit
MFQNDISHHAHLIEGNSKEILPELFASIKKNFEIERQGNPDFSFEEMDSFSIDDARHLKETQGNSAFSNTKKIFVITTNSMTHEAQNSLLKVFEEPTPNTHFFIIIPSAQNILPTLKSRLLIVTHKSRSKVFSKEDANKFIKSSPKERLEMIKNLVDEEDKGKMRVEARNLLESILVIKRESVLSHKADSKTVSSLENMMRGLSYLSDRSSSSKLILEQIALTL